MNVSENGQSGIGPEFGHRGSSTLFGWSFIYFFKSTIESKSLSTLSVWYTGMFYIIL